VAIVFSSRPTTVTGRPSMFFTELARRASALAGGQDAVDRFLKWKLPSSGASGDEDHVAVETEDLDDEDV
jgi:hypothetical protein